MNKLFSDAVLAFTSAFLLRANSESLAFGLQEDTGIQDDDSLERPPKKTQRTRQGPDNNSENMRLRPKTQTT